MYIVYVKTDEQGRVTDINSSAFLEQTEGWVEIARGDTPAHMHAQGRYLPLPIHDEDGLCNWALTGGVICRRSDEEKALDAENLQSQQHASISETVATLQAQMAEMSQALDMLLLGVTEDEPV